MTKLFPFFALLCYGAGIDDLKFMSGCWAGDGVEEQWNQPRGGQMMGLARTLRGERVVFSEFMRIQLKDGVLVYTPRIGTKAPPVDFKAIKQSATEVVFENAEHNFPQRIIYRQTQGGLFARIEGKDKGKERGEDFPMRAVPCSGARPQL
ncbi:MAG: hypothetical protein HYX27_10725 [Acidobacteria bacterium]|nr:hypothetical protein [Acidobacteriota bacterium]